MRKSPHNRETMYIFAINIDCRSLPLPGTDKSIETAGITNFWNRKPQVLGKMKLKITLNKSVAKSLLGPLPFLPSPNEHYLSEAAFKPRTFTVTIEKGNFVPHRLIGYENNYSLRYGLRLLFDKSIYQIREWFKMPEWPPISDVNFEEMHIFVARRLPQSQTKGKAMSDDFSGFRRGCTIA